MVLGVLSYFLFCCVVLLGFLALAGLLSFTTSNPFYDKSGAFECGFQPFCSPGVSFSMPFFVISLMFLLFDVEIILVSFPPLVSGGYFSATVYFFVLVLILLATVYEWFSGVLEWVSSFYY